MKLKSLLAIASCSAIALSISLPSIAEKVNDSKVESSSIGIGNKDYRNKQSTPSMVGSWKSGIKDNEHRHTDPQEIYFDMTSDFSAIFAFRREGQADTFGSGSYYRYTPTKDPSIVIQESLNSDGEVTSIVGVKWISNNEFIIRILKEPEAPHREGIQRRFLRIDKPVATILQERAQQAAAREESRRNLQRARDNYDDVNNSWPQFWDASGSIDTTPLSP